MKRWGLEVRSIYIGPSDVTIQLNAHGRLFRFLMGLEKHFTVRGISTVWHYYPNGSRCGSSVEAFCASAARAALWAEAARNAREE